MTNIFVEEYKQVLFALIKNKVDFIIIGGYAVIYYGYDRNTGDMDIWLQTGNENRDKLINALRDFGIIDEHLETLKKMDFTNPVPVFYFGEIPRKIEFITLISNVKFEDAIQHVNYLPVENEKVPVIHYNDLILSKLTSNRLKDKADIEELERINKHREGK
jgi:hypothetical protein